ncbi:MAG: penicillin-binding protein [Chitinophagaceae bacterium]|nr:penicillin-binding protein [Oligoflexus sp.]
MLSNLLQTLKSILTERQFLPKRWTLIPTLIGSILAITLVSGISLIVWLSSAGLFEIDESKLDVIVNYEHSDNSLVFDKSGKQIGEFFSDYHVYYPYAKIPPLMVHAVLSIEDRSFFEHHGLDYKAIARAGVSLLKTGHFRQGASTITQQVVRNFLLTPERKLSRKIKEAAFALQLERRVSKERILEIYLNALFLGQGSYGVAAAAQRHFGKTLDDLGPHEIALIAGLFQSPTRFNPHKNPKAAKKRQLLVLKAMVANGFLEPSDYKKWSTEPLVYQVPASMNQSIAPFFLDAIQEQTDKILQGKFKGKGLRITTTLDLSLQQELNTILQGSKSIYSTAANALINVKNPKESMIEAASLVMNHRSGEILAMVGGRDFSRSQFNRALKAKRAPGSCFKPLVYSQALMGGMNWSDMTYITPIVIQNYRPQNYSNEFMSESTYFNAFYRSINTPVVELGSRIGIKKIIETARKMGVKTELKPQAGTLLGGSEMTMTDLAQIYGTIGNDGNKPDPFMIEKITTRNGVVVYEHKAAPVTRVLPPAVAYMMTMAMQAVFRFGTAAKYPEFASYAAGKTGTTNEAKDNWFCGFTHDITSIVWVGTDDNYAFSGAVAGASMALPIWARMMERIKDRYPPLPFEMPEGVVKKRIHPLFGFEDANGVEMPLLEGRGPTRHESTLTIVRDTGSFRDALDW